MSERMKSKFMSICQGLEYSDYIPCSGERTPLKKNRGVLGMTLDAADSEASVLEI